MKRIALLLVFLLLFAHSVALAAAEVQLNARRVSMLQEEIEWRERKRLERLQEEARQDTLDKLRRQYEPKEKEYYKNTVCSFGPQFKDISARLTDEWYMFTPLDLSQDGVQKYDLIGGNMYVIGEITVTVKSGTVTVEYAYADRSIQVGREYFTFFADIDSVEKSALENFHMQKKYSYGRAYSIEKKLGGDTDVLLFVCNTATFQKTTPNIIPYHSTNPDRVELREAMLDMIGR